MESGVKYRYARDVSNRTVDATALRRDSISDQASFYCLGCDGRLIPKLGDERRWHFAHKSNSQCSGETYLHNLGKMIFKEEYERCLAEGKPYWVEYQQRIYCNAKPGVSEVTCSYINAERYNLTKVFRSIKIERKVGEFVPDIVITSACSEQIIFIEIAVTHKCSDRKQASKNRIIEISASREEDFQVFREHCLSETNPALKFINFGFKRRLGKELCSWFRRCRVDSYVPPETEPDPNIDRLCRFCEHCDYHGRGNCEKGHRIEFQEQARACEDFTRVDGEQLGGRT